MSETNGTEELFAQWRKVRDTFMEGWAKTMVETVNSDAYAETSASVLNAFLTTYSPFREMMEKTISRSLEQLSMPTRGDITSLAERMTNVEMRLDDLDAKVDAILAAVTQRVQAAEPTDPAPGRRTRPSRGRVDHVR